MGSHGTHIATANRGTPQSCHLVTLGILQYRRPHTCYVP